MSSLRLRHASLACTGLLAIVLGSCQVPDVGPFVDGTAQLNGAVAAGGAAVEQELRFAFSDSVRADALHASWDARNKAMRALLRYAQSIDAIVAAGNAGAESAGRVADSVKGLAEAAGIAIPGSAEAVAVATDTAKFLYAQVAKVRAAAQLAAALDEAQPAIERLAQLMRKDLDDLDVVAQAAAGLQTADLAAGSNKVSADRKSVLFAMKNLDPGVADQRAEYQKLNDLLAAIKPRYDAYLQEQKKIEDRLESVRAVIDATGRALDEWAAAHGELASAARHKRLASAQSLIAAATELRDLVKRMRDL